jgi:hypothetical protein
MKHKSKPPVTKRLKVKYDEPLSSFAFKFNLRRYGMGRKMIIFVDDLNMPQAGAYTLTLLSAT